MSASLYNSGGRRDASDQGLNMTDVTFAPRTVCALIYSALIYSDWDNAAPSAAAHGRPGKV